MTSPDTATPPPAPARRRLHQLPADARELLVALSWTPAALRSLLERVLGRVRGNPVRLQGSDADVLASLSHDLAQRNAISEALHRQLSLRHAVAVQRLAAARGEKALRSAWQARPETEAPVASLWALLTHPQGSSVQEWAIRELRVSLYAQAHAAQSGQLSQATALARMKVLQAEADGLRQRLLSQQQQSDRALQAAQAALAQARGEAAAARILGATPAVRPSLTPASRPQAAPARTQPGAPAEAPSAAAPAPAPASPPITVQAPTPPPATSPVQGRRVLCVGGIQHAVARYRNRIETLGGRFEHHDGGIHDNAHALDGRLARADLVICQAGCINHAAYHRIKQHCQRTGTPCLYLERASLSRFDRALQGLQAEGRPATTRPAEASHV